MLRLEAVLLFDSALDVTHRGIPGQLYLQHVATALGNHRLLPLILWLATILIALAIGYARFGHMDTNRADDGTRAFTMTLTVIADVALGAYAIITAYLRRSEVKRDKKQDDAEDAADMKEAAEDAAEAAAREDDKWMPGFEGVYYKDGTLAKKIGGGYLPLLSLRPQR